MISVSLSLFFFFHSFIAPNTRPCRILICHTAWLDTEGTGRRRWKVGSLVVKFQVTTA